MSSTEIRWLIRRDMPEVLAIEKQCFEFPWCEDDFLSCLRQRNCISMVGERDGKIVGYMVYEFHKTRLSLLNFAVTPKYQRSGVGSAFLARLKGKLSPQRRTAIALEVSETNLPAQFFFRSAGFRATCVLHGPYDGTDEDAYGMVYQLPSPGVNRVGALFEEQGVT